jgi:polyhydroxybutyrate depolymerase
VSAASLRARKLAVWVAVMVAVVAALAAALWRASPTLYGRQEARSEPHAYGADEPVACVAGSRPGPPEGSTREVTPGGTRYLVKTPANYDPTRAHPLIVVFAPHGVNRLLSERFVGLTRAATRHGFVVAYADSRPLDAKALEDLGRIPSRVADRWCIDEHRVFFTGHSDGGTVATALTVLRKAIPPAAIAPSAAGFRGADLAAYACPPPVAVMVQHGRNDDLFPGFGREAAAWWAACNGCRGEPEPRADGCLAYPACRAGGATLYCEDESRHVEWPRRNERVLEFFESAAPLPRCREGRGADRDPSGGPHRLELVLTPAADLR